MSGGTRIKAGAIYGTGADLTVRTIGFRPKVVRIFNQTDLSKADWTESMADDSAMKQITAGTITFITTNGITPLSNGFGLGADAELNADGDLIHYVAEE